MCSSTYEDQATTFNFLSAIHECSESMLSSVLPNVAGNGKKRISYLCSKNRAIIAQKTNVLCNCMYAKHHFSIGKQWKSGCWSYH